MPGLLKCVTNAGYTLAAGKQAAAIKTQATIDSAIQVAVALWQRNASLSISNMQREIANDQVTLAEEVHAHAVLFFPEEAELVNDAFGVAFFVADYVGLIGAWTALVTDAETTGRRLWLETSRQLCMPPNRCSDARWQRNEQALVADIANFAARQAESRAQVLNDVRYARMLAVLGLGRGRTQELVTYQRISQTIGAQAGELLQDSIGSAMRAYGFYRTREQPPTGWAQGIKQSWSRAPEATLTRGIQMEPPATVTQLPPVPQIAPPAPAAEPTTKLNEMQQGFDIADKLWNGS